VRTGLTPAVNALALILITLTVIGAAIYEVLRRREAARDAAAQRRAQQVQPMRELELGVSVPGAD
jgi:spermidine/putrescine transport system permease protein